MSYLDDRTLFIQFMGYYISSLFDSKFKLTLSDAKRRIMLICEHNLDLQAIIQILIILVSNKTPICQAIKPYNLLWNTWNCQSHT